MTAVLSATPAGVMRVVPGDVGWSSAHTLAGEDVRRLAVHGAVVFAGTHDQGVLRSDDSGKT